MLKVITLIVSHLLFAAGGFIGGIYTLPILMAGSSPSEAEVSAAKDLAQFTGEFRRDLKDSDFLHWGEGVISIGEEMIALKGKLAPGPDYQLYLSPQFIETEAQFNLLKSQMVRVAPINTFDNFIVNVPDNINPSDYSAVIVWCESFGEFITAASYQ